MSEYHFAWTKPGTASALLLLSALAVPATAQEAPLEPESEGERVEQTETQSEGIQQAARTADTGIGEVGQRQTARDGAALQEPLERISSRINNRVENRIRNRIDRNYDPTANATSPYAIADQKTRAAGRRGPR